MYTPGADHHVADQQQVECLQEVRCRRAGAGLWRLLRWGRGPDIVVVEQDVAGHTAEVRKLATNAVDSTAMHVSCA